MIGRHKLLHRIAGGDRIEPAGTRAANQRVASGGDLLDWLRASEPDLPTDVETSTYSIQLPRRTRRRNARMRDERVTLEPERADETNVEPARARSIDRDGRSQECKRARESRVDMFKTTNPIPNALAVTLTGLMAAMLVLAPFASSTASAEADAASAQDVAALDPSGGDPSGESIDVAAADANSPLPAVETFHAGLLDIMKQAKELGFDGRVDKLAPLMGQAFDLDFMASKTVGRHWKKLSDEDKTRWAAIFTRFTTANYAGRFTGYTGEEFVTLGVEDGARGTRTVLTKIIVPDGDDVSLNYRLLERKGEWKIIDVYLNGTVSELALRRSEYSSALKRDGFEQLIASIETKIADLKAKGSAEG